MLNERTAQSAVVSPPDEPASTSPSDALRRLADFLDALPGLPRLYITLSRNQQVGLQVSAVAGGPEERSLAVARVAQALDADTHLTPASRGTWDFEAHGNVNGLDIHVYAPLAAIDPAPAEQSRQERS
ncbi:hypothetical protein ACFV3F_39260 [Streptomyces sp. NPDC059717]|uniref:hypothetical protein n=1 Tax=Streptomyces sp. NPDC059717 TaxID=3346922 RepID=UPI0036C5A90C